MDSDNNRGTDDRQENVTTLPEVLAEIHQLARNVNGVITAVSAWVGTPQGKSVAKRLDLLLNAIGGGGVIPDSGTYSLPWLALLTGRTEQSVRDQANKKNVPIITTGDQRMHRAKDFTRNFAEKSE